MSRARTARAALDRAARESGARVRAALAARFRDLDLAEEAWAEACARAVERWHGDGPEDPAAWLHHVAFRAALDSLRRRAVRGRHVEVADGEPGPEEDAMIEAALMPDDRLRLIFICCHPAVAPDARAALTLRLVCGLETGEIARAFLVSEPTMAQRLLRAKAKVRAAGVPFGLPRPEAWGERLDAVLSTIEVAYAQAHGDADGSGEHARHGPEMLALARLLADLLPDEPEALGLAATLAFNEARRPARVTEGAMVPLSEQDPARWDRGLIAEGDRWLRRAERAQGAGARVAQAAIGRAWCARPDLRALPPWAEVLAAYDRLMPLRDDPFVRLNRAVALAEVRGAQEALDEVNALPAERLDDFAPLHAVRADLLRRLGRPGEARRAYDRALALGPARAERAWLEARRSELHPTPQDGSVGVPASGASSLG